MAINRNTLVIIIACLIAFSLLYAFIPGPGYNDHSNVLISVASFLFGLYVAFSVATVQGRLSKVNEILKSDEGILLNIFRLSEVFGNQVQQQVKVLLDNYLIDQIDYYLQDFRYSSKTFASLFDYCLNLKTENNKQEAVYSEIISSLNKSAQNRKQVESLVLEKISTLEWLSILLLLGLILFFLFYMNDASLISGVTSAILSTVAITLTFVLRDLNSFRWKEQSAIWEPLNNLFSELGLLPYYPDGVIEGKRVKLSKGQTIRMAKYPNPYPDMSGKEVREIEI